jgi:hypothetical protein
VPLFPRHFLGYTRYTIAGFGSSTIFLPLALFFVDFQTALILVAISHLFGNLGRINFFKLPVIPYQYFVTRYQTFSSAMSL